MYQLWVIWGLRGKGCADYRIEINKKWYSTEGDTVVPISNTLLNGS